LSNSDDPRQQAKDAAEELQRMQQEDPFTETYAGMQDEMPNVASALKKKRDSQFSALLSKAPAGMFDPVYGDRLPTLSEARKFNRWVEAYLSPDAVIKMISEGQAHPDHLEALGELYPQLYRTTRVSAMSGVALSRTREMMVTDPTSSELKRQRIRTKTEMLDNVDNRQKQQEQSNTARKSSKAGNMAPGEASAMRNEL
jgi:hypothetical protein